MADDRHEIELVITARQRAAQAIRTVRDQVRGLGSAVRTAMRAIAIGAGLASGALLLLVNRGTKVESVATVFEATAERLGMSSRDLLSHLRAVTRGTVTSFQLMAQANAALGTGALTLGDFSTALEFVGLKAKATGEDVDALTSKIITGLLRGSVMLLDDALPTLTRSLDTLDMEGLTPAQKKTVTLQVAFRLMREELGTLRLTVDDTRDRFEQVGTEVGNLRDRLGLILIQSPEVGRVFETLADRLREASIWLVRNTDRVEDWVVAAIQFAKRAGEATLRVAEWAIEHRRLLLALAKVAALGVLLSVLIRLGSAYLTVAKAARAAAVATGLAAFISLIAQVRSLADALVLARMGFAGLVSFLGPGGLLVVGVAALTFGVTALANAFRRARLEKRGFLQEGVDLGQVAESLRGMQASTGTMRVGQERGGRITVPTLEGSREILETVEALNRSGSIGRKGRSLLRSIIGDIEETQDLQRKVELLNILRDRAIALIDVAQRRREADEAELERLREMGEELRKLNADGAGGIDIQELLKQMQGAVSPVEALSQRLELLQAHFRLGEESGESYRAKLAEIRRDALALAEANRTNAAVVVGAAEVYGRAADELSRMQEATDAAREASLRIAAPLVATIDLFEALSRLGRLSTGELVAGLEAVREKILQLAQREDLTAEQTIALADALDRVNQALQGTKDKASELEKGIERAVGEALVSSLRSAADALAQVFGSMFADLEDADQPFRRLLARVLSIFGDMLIGAGIMAIGLGSVIEAIRTAILSLTGAPAFAAGAAAIAIGALLKGASAALMSSVGQAAGGGSPTAGSSPFRVDLPSRDKERETTVNVYVLDELGERRVARLQQRLSSNQRRDVSIRVPLGG